MDTFLIADDSDGKVMMLEVLLHKSGFEGKIFRARTTEEAKMLIDREKPTAAFIDYEMPSEQGPAVIRYLREAIPEAKIAMVSSCNLEEYRSDAMEAGADTYVCSSFEADLVEKTVLDLLKEWKIA